MLRALYGNNVLKTALFKWIKRFREGREDFKHEQGKDDSRCPVFKTTLNVCSPGDC